MRYENMVPGTFVSRPNRFIAKVRLTGGEEVTAHVKNTGRCRELLISGCTVYLQDHAGAMGKRKLRYSLIAVDKVCGRGRLLINMDSQAPNKIVGEALAGGRFSEVFSDELKDMDFDFGNLSEISPEKTFGDSRFDFRLTDRDGRVCWMEVKGVTLEEKGVARFPDAPTERGVKHVCELVKAVSAGDSACIVFVIQMKGIKEFRPNDETHRAFGDALRNAHSRGVKILAFDCNVGIDSAEISDKIEVVL